jgi:hypothetical protein
MGLRTLFTELRRRRSDGGLRRLRRETGTACGLLKIAESSSSNRVIKAPELSQKRVSGIHADLHGQVSA